MDYIELSIEDIARHGKKLAENVSSWGIPDVVIFIARAGYLLGDEIAKYFQVPLLAINASRKASSIKALVAPLLKVLPVSVKKIMRTFEVSSSYHSTNAERAVSFNNEIWSSFKNSDRVVLVDDSIDTGNTILAVKGVLRSFFLNADIKVAALNYFSSCDKNLIPDYYLWVDKLLNGPWSSDSKWRKKFNALYSDAEVHQRFF
jgi:hypoxanthine phosphoribosyltransferase